MASNLGLRNYRIDKDKILIIGLLYESKNEHHTRALRLGKIWQCSSTSIRQGTNEKKKQLWREGGLHDGRDSELLRNLNYDWWEFPSPRIVFLLAGRRETVRNKFSDAIDAAISAEPPLKIVNFCFKPTLNAPIFMSDGQHGHPTKCCSCSEVTDRQFFRSQKDLTRHVLTQTRKKHTRLPVLALRRLTSSSTKFYIYGRTEYGKCTILGNLAIASKTHLWERWKEVGQERGGNFSRSVFSTPTLGRELGARVLTLSC